MKAFLFVLPMVVPVVSFADNQFEINQKNCNLPIQEIRKMLSDQSRISEVLKQCLEKANEEKWTRNKLVKQ